MVAFTILLYAAAILWVVGGGVWLARRRRYRLRDLPAFAVDLAGLPVELAQSLWGRGGVPYALLLPNMLIFGTFTFLPMILNLYVSMTDGSSISVFSRPFVGLEKYADIFACGSILDPRTCSNSGFTFWTSFFNTLVFVLFQVPVLCAVALATALVVNKPLVGRGFWRAMFFYPVMLSPVVIANIWQWVLHRKGVLNAALAGSSERITAVAAASGFDLVMSVIFAILLFALGERALRAGQEPSPLRTALFALPLVAVLTWARPLAWLIEAPWTAHLALAAAVGIGLFWLVADARPGARAAIIAAMAAGLALLLTIQFTTVFDLGRYRPVNWLVTQNTGWPFFWLVFVFCWSHMGFYMLILLAGLQAIPRDLYEAAEMDAAKPVRVFFRITLPLIMPTFIVVLVLSLIRSFQVFDEVYLLTGGGPGRETFMLVQNIYEVAFTGTNPDYGEAAAGSVLMAVVIAVFTFTQLYISRRQAGI